MPDVLTTIYQFVEPEVGGSDDTWGTKLNTNWSKVELLLSQAFDSGSPGDVGTLNPARLPTSGDIPYVKKSGDTMTGPLVIATAADPGLILADTNGTADARRWRMFAGSDGGSLFISPVNDAGVYTANNWLTFIRNGNLLSDVRLVLGENGATAPTQYSVINRDRGDARYLRTGQAITVGGQLTVAAGGAEITGALHTTGGATIDGALNVSNGANIQGATVVKSSAGGNSIIYLRSEGNVDRGLLWSSPSEGAVRLRAYNVTGTVYGELVVNADGSIDTQGTVRVQGAVTTTLGVTASGTVQGAGMQADNPGTNVNIFLKQNGNNRGVLFWNNSDSTLRLGIYNGAADALVGQIVMDRAGSISAASGAEFTGLNASNLNSGIVPAARLSTANVLSAVAGAAAAAVGSYAFAVHSSGNINFGANVAASSLTPTNASGAAGNSISAGTWKCMGYCGSPDADDRSTLWMRVL